MGRAVNQEMVDDLIDNEVLTEQLIEKITFILKEHKKFTNNFKRFIDRLLQP